MAETPDDHHEKEGISIADVVKCGARLECCADCRILPGDLSPDENGQHVSLHLCLLAQWPRLASSARAMEMAIRSPLSLTTRTDNKDSKVGTRHQMTRALLVLGITLAAALPAKADITHKIQSSVQLQVDGAASQASRIGSTLAFSGSNVT